MSEYYDPVRNCLEVGRNLRFCTGAEEAAATIKALQDRLGDLQTRFDAVWKRAEGLDAMVGERDGRLNDLSRRLPRWRIAVDEVPTEDGEYLVAWPRTGGGWNLQFDYYEVESEEFAGDYPAGAMVLWMPYPEFPKVRLVERQNPETCSHKWGPRIGNDRQCERCGWRLLFDDPEFDRTREATTRTRGWSHEP